MTKPVEPVRCRWCRRPIVDQAPTGRPRQYCRRSCRQRDYEARRHAGEVGLAETELVVTRHDLDRLKDALYALAMAVEDVERDVAASPTKRDLELALDHLLAAARPAVEAGDLGAP